MKSAAEWRTLALILGCYGLWYFIATTDSISPAFSLPLLALLLTLHSSLQHEVLHGHPFCNDRFNELLGFPPLSLAFPFSRFKTLHLQHHRLEWITDPKRDPESNYLTPEQWHLCSNLQQRLFYFNNSLAGRLSIGPAISLYRFWHSEFHRIIAGDWQLAKVWTSHCIMIAALLYWLTIFAEISALQYVICAYFSTAILQIRTFLEHRAHPNPQARSVIIEDRGLLAFLFLNNNFHAVHHARQDLPWYQIPAEYVRHKSRYLEANQGYYYASYKEIFRRYFFSPKDSVKHPLILNSVVGREKDA